ncbi:MULTISPECIES: hypothetical protein [unclassified Coleofasciculus]|uniref:hypothetical protein n=1 Tax=unclassified Coleofasciculus TaxID=2692782 RepID=UPI001880EE5B|nr:MULTISPECIES: hypothetical protein [unclassified Coleofasciculus]MBE9126587.1 hypothetical protein [Coleofasciculus sp. LEGE 07081]MBE9149932.1 hypothetical protein [Coleofasciculus sp. LEGE 07092]
MYNYRAILQRVGIVLIAVGILDIAYMVYCISQDQSYSSIFNILAVVAGVFLFRGSLRAVPIVTCFAAFMISNFVSVFILLPFLKPAELWAIEFHLDPVDLSMSLLVRITLIALLCWVYTQLRAAPVVSASFKYAHSASTPKLAFILGVALVVLPVGIMHFTRGGAAGAKAVEVARAKYGQDYKYHVTAMGWSNGNVQAHLTAYNEQEIKPVQVEWKQ